MCGVLVGAFELIDKEKRHDKDLVMGVALFTMYHLLQKLLYAAICIIMVSGY